MKPDNDHSLKAFCERHQPPKDYPEIGLEAVTMVMFEKLVKSPEFIGLLEECSDNRTKEVDVGTVMEIWNSRYPTMCCFFGDEGMVEILKVDLPKALEFGVQSRPISIEEAEHYMEGGEEFSKN